MLPSYPNVAKRNQNRQPRGVLGQVPEAHLRIAELLPDDPDGVLDLGPYVSTPRLAVAELCCKHGMSAATYYAWKSRYAGASVSDPTRMREQEAENARLKLVYAELALDAAAMKEVIAREW